MPPHFLDDDAYTGTPPSAPERVHAPPPRTRPGELEIWNAGAGGLSGITYEPIRDPTPPGTGGSRSFTGQPVGPVVPSNRPVAEILERIKEPPAAPRPIDGPYSRWWKPYAGERESPQDKEPTYEANVPALLKNCQIARMFFKKIGDLEMLNLHIIMLTREERYAFNREWLRLLADMERDPSAYGVEEWSHEDQVHYAKHRTFFRLFVCRFEYEERWKH